MTYELAKQLKEAGYPQKDMRCSYCKEHEYENCTQCEDAVDAFPTLSELIEVCGDEFGALLRTPEARLWLVLHKV